MKSKPLRSPKCPECKEKTFQYFCSNCEETLCWRCLKPKILRWPMKLITIGKNRNGIRVESMEYIPLEEFPEEYCKCYPISTVYVTPECCDEVKKHASVHLYVDINAPFTKQKPKWVVRGMIPQHMRDASIVDAQFCPHCGSPVPKIVPSNIPYSWICKVTDSGYYCSTCKGRLGSCNCAPSEFRWKPAK